MKKALLCLCALLLLVPGAFAQEEVPWELIKDKKGVRTYMRKFPGTEVREFKTIMLMNARLEVIAAVLRDIPNYTQWFPQCKESYVIEDIDYYRKKFYNKVNLPWPLYDRDVVIENNVDFQFETGRAVAHFWALNDGSVPPARRTVRITDLKGWFLFEYMGRSTTRVMFAYQVDPGGEIPMVLANLAIRMMPYMTLVKLQKMTEEPKYIEIAEKSEDKRLVEELIADDQTVETALRGRLTEYFQYPELVETIVSDPDLVEKVRSDNVTFDDMRLRIAEILRMVLVEVDVRRYFQDKELASWIATDPELVEDLMEDWLLVEMIMDRSGTFEQLLRQRAEHYR